MMESLTLSTRSHSEFRDLTSEIKELIKKSGIKNGLAVIYVPHTTAGITINESADRSVAADLIDSLEKNFPWSDNYRHLEGNAAAHIKASLMGSSVTLIVAEGIPLLGTWQGIYFCEFDGPRSRRIIVKIIAGD